LSISILTAVLFGLAPALQNTRLNLQEVLKESTHTTTAGGARQHFRRALVVIQVAVAFVLLVGAGLLARSFKALLEVDAGFTANKRSRWKFHWRDARPSSERHFSIKHWRSLPQCPAW